MGVVDAHAQTPGGALTAAELVQCGWLRVPLAPLRRLGVREHLLTHDEGYLLDPNAQVAVGRL